MKNARFILAILVALALILVSDLNLNWLQNFRILAAMRITGCLVFFLAFWWGKDVSWFQSIRPMSIIRVWSHDGVTAVSADEDYRYWWTEQNRYELLRGFVSMPSPRTTRKPAPQFTAFFSDNTLVPASWQQGTKSWGPDDWKTGNMIDCARLLKGCQVERSEIFIPQSSYQWTQRLTTPISLASAWRLIHGPDVKLPESTS